MRKLLIITIAVTVIKKITYSTTKKQFKKRLIVCEKCNMEDNITLRSTNYFTSIDLSYQLQMLFSYEKTKADIFNYIDNMSKVSSSNTMKDVSDGELYKKVNEGNVKYITYNYSTDGAPLTKSGKRAFWPLQITLNCLKPILRFRYVLLGGLLTCTKEPNSDLINLYFSKFVNQVHTLFQEGITVTNLNHEDITIKFCPLSCPVDSVCRPILQNRLQFNAYCGCSWCYQLGQYIKSVLGIRYVLQQDDNLRTHESHLNDLAKLQEQQASSINQSNKSTAIRGVKGDISLLQIPNVDMVWSFCFEFMHAILSGVSSQIYKKLTSDPSSPYRLNKKQLDIVEKRLTLIKPTKNIHRLPRALKDRAKWTSAEILYWDLFYSLPCLTDVLDQEALNHYSLLVKSLYILLSDDISEENLLQCEQDLLKFVAYYEMYYKAESMTFNVHSLLHAVESVRKNGPFWATSAFPYEGNIHQLKMCKTGPNEMDQQMIKKTLTLLKFKTENIADISCTVSNYCAELFIPRYLNTYYNYGEEGVLFIGNHKLVRINDICYKEYKKCIYHGEVLHSVKYRKTLSTDDTTVQLNSGEYCQINKILSKNGSCYLQISKITTCLEKPFQVLHIEKVQKQDVPNTELISISNFKCKIIHINFSNVRYLCKIPKFYGIN